MSFLNKHDKTTTLVPVCKHEQGCQRSGKSQGKNIFSRSVKSQGISPKVREFCDLLEKSGKSQGIL